MKNLKFLIPVMIAVVSNFAFANDSVDEIKVIETVRQESATLKASKIANMLIAVNPVTGKKYIAGALETVGRNTSLTTKNTQTGEFYTQEISLNLWSEILGKIMIASEACPVTFKLDKQSHNLVDLEAACDEKSAF